MAKIKIGDIFEINTSKGKAYLHYVFKDETNGDLVRILSGLYSDRPAELESLASKKESFFLFFPLSAANRKKIVEKVGYYVSDITRPKYMRTEHYIHGEFLGWHIINTDTWERELVKELSDDQKQLSPWGVWNDTLLIERLEEGWTLNSWC